MRRKLGAVCMALGVVLLLGALGLFLWNENEADRAEAASAELMTKLSVTIEENVQKQPNSPSYIGTPDELLPPEEKKMTEVEIDGYGYIGYLTIPRLGLELPIMADWDYTRLKIAPCRYSGTTMEENLVLVAHNYRKHFGPIRRLVPGDEAAFVDMDGNVTCYLVAAVDVVPPSSVEEVTSGSFDLALVTCTYGGNTRLVVYCDVYEPES